jgi:hypothetical protein
MSVPEFSSRLKGETRTKIYKNCRFYILNFIVLSDKVFIIFNESYA